MQSREEVRVSFGINPTEGLSEITQDNDKDSTHRPAHPNIHTTQRAPTALLSHDWRRESKTTNSDLLLAMGGGQRNAQEMQGTLGRMEAELTKLDCKKDVKGKGPEMLATSTPEMSLL